jgi:hypothetical protein
MALIRYTNQPPKKIQEPGTANTDIVFHAGPKDVPGAKGPTLRDCRIDDVGIAVTTGYAGSQDLYVAHNMIIGRDDR